MSSQDSDFTSKIQSPGFADAYTLKDIISTLSASMSAMHDKFVGLSNDVNIMNTNFSFLSKKVEEISESLKKLNENQIQISHLEVRVSDLGESVKSIGRITDEHQRFIDYMREKDKKRDNLKDILMRTWLYPLVGGGVIALAWLIDLFYRTKGF